MSDKNSIRALYYVAQAIVAASEGMNSWKVIGDLLVNAEGEACPHTPFCRNVRDFINDNTGSLTVNATRIAERIRDPWLNGTQGPSKTFIHAGYWLGHAGGYASLSIHGANHAPEVRKGLRQAENDFRAIHQDALANDTGNLSKLADANQPNFSQLKDSIYNLVMHI